MLLKKPSYFRCCGALASMKGSRFDQSDRRLKSRQPHKADLRRLEVVREGGLRVVDATSGAKLFKKLTLPRPHLDAWVGIKEIVRHEVAPGKLQRRRMVKSAHRVLDIQLAAQLRDRRVF